LRQNPPAANRRHEQWRDAKEDTSMPRLQSKLLDTDQVPSEHIEGLTPIKESSSLDEWRGRFWLPDGDRVDPTRKYCLVGHDGRAGEMIMDNFVVSYMT